MLVTQATENGSSFGLLGFCSFEI